MNRLLKTLGAAALLALPAMAAIAQATPVAAGPGLPLLVGASGGGTNFSVPIQTLLFFTALSFLPAILLMMTGFTRIVIVLSLFRQAIGTQAAPPNQVITGLSLFLTFFVMSPTIDKVYTEAWAPYQANQISFADALDKGQAPMRSAFQQRTWWPSAGPVICTGPALQRASLNGQRGENTQPASGFGEPAIWPGMEGSRKRRADAANGGNEASRPLL